MLSKMFYEGADYDEVLKEAQDNGYAERNPEADVEGYDACRKIAILSSLISGQQVDFEDIYTEGITKITKKDMLYAKKLGMTIKLIASSKRHDDHVHAIVAPMLLNMMYLMQCSCTAICLAMLCSMAVAQESFRQPARSWPMW